MRNSGVTSILVVILAVFSVRLYSATNNENIKKVLVLHSYHYSFDWTSNINRGIEEQFAKSGLEVEIYEEYMDTKRNDPKVFYPILQNLYHKKYKNIVFDVILLSDNIALNFVMKYGKDLFKNAPVVFCGINNFSDDLIKGYDNITGIVEAEDMKGTIELILDVHKNLDTIYLLSDSTITGKLHLEKIRKIINQNKYKVRFDELYNWSEAELIHALKTLKRKSVILHLHMYKDRTGKRFSNKESQYIIEKNSSVPSYTMWKYKFDYGMTGGIVTSGEMQGVEAAKKAIKILQGEKAASVDILRKSPNVTIFDYNRLIKYGIPFDRLPENSTILNEPVTFYTKYKYIIWGVLLFLVFQFVVIIFLLSNIAKRKRAEKVIKKSLKEKEILVKEIHHRVKNNLQIVEGLIQLHLGFMDDQAGSDVFRDLFNRVHAMGIIHQKLYKSQDFSTIHYNEYIGSMVSKLLESYNKDESQIKIKMELDDVVLSIEAAVPCGLLINEIVSNSLKHAFPENRNGTISISMRKIKNLVVFVISDNGIGMEELNNAAMGKKLGMQLINSLTEQLNADLQLDSKNGTTYTITFGIGF